MYSSRLSSPKRRPSPHTFSPLKKPRTSSENRRSRADRFFVEYDDMKHYDITKSFENDGQGTSFVDTTAAKEEYCNTLSNVVSPKSIVTPISPGRKVSAHQSLLANESVFARPMDGNRKKQKRKIPVVPERILDAPDFVDDYYLNLLDWSQDNIVAVALGPCVFLWNAFNGQIHELCSLEDDHEIVTSLCWANEGQFIAVGTSSGEVKLYDAHALRQLRNIKQHRQRVSCLSWNGQLLSSGSRDTCIYNYDVGLQNPTVSSFRKHDQEVCGLKWNAEGTMLASGGNDNLLLVWDIHNSSQPRLTLDRHQAAVKAIAWSPHQANLLTSGGGTADRHIRFWNTTTGACIGEKDTKSQVCSIMWSKNYPNELVSSHGFSQNQLIVWEYPRMTKLCELTGHTARVLQMAMSPDGETVVSVAGDETLRFWRIFEKNRSTKPMRSKKPVSNTQSIR